MGQSVRPNCIPTSHADIYPSYVTGLFSNWKSPLHSPGRCAWRIGNPCQLCAISICHTCAWDRVVGESIGVGFSINMLTGSTKTALYQYLHGIFIHVRERCGYQHHDPAWLLGDAWCEKMGDLMASNGRRLLGLYDELTSFLIQLNLYGGKGVTMYVPWISTLSPAVQWAILDTFYRYTICVW